MRRGFRFAAGWCFLTLLLSGVALARPPLEPVSFDLFQKLFPLDDSVWQRKGEVLRGIQHSLDYLRSNEAQRAYQKYEGTSLDRSRVIQSLLRFRTLLFKARSSDELVSMLRKDFRVMRSSGRDGEGEVKFTGYFQPVFKASLTRSAKYRYPIYQLPENFGAWPKPHYSRVNLEGFDGLGNARGPLVGKELAFLANRFEAYMIHVQGSAILELENGQHLAVGFAGATEHPFRGVPKEFLHARGIKWADVGEYFKSHPEDFNRILSQNNRFIFFKVNQFSDPVGCLGVPVVAKRSIATDKSMMPPGALALIHTLLPEKVAGNISVARKPQFVFDHDTGKAIKGPGRVDVFMGTGQEAGKLANYVSSTGALYYLLLK